MSEKNMADVADKMVDKISAGVETLAQAFERAAPVVWQAEARFQLTWAIGMLAAQTIAIVVAAIVFRKARSMYKADDCEFHCFLFAAACALGAIAVGVSLAHLPETLATLFNPEREAVRALARSFK